MMRGPSQTFASDLDILHQIGTVSGPANGDLLGRLAARERGTAQQAFEAILHRHGPMMLGVCRRLLRDEHAAEAAILGTFLALAINAAAIRKVARAALLGLVALATAAAQTAIGREPPEPMLPDRAHVRLGTRHLRHDGQVHEVIFSPDGRTVASTSFNEICFWDIATGAPAQDDGV